MAQFVANRCHTWGWYVSLPLEATYQAARRGVPRRFRDVLEPPNRER
jgi:hypothetical protein